MFTALKGSQFYFYLSFIAKDSGQREKHFATIFYDNRSTSFVVMVSLELYNGGLWRPLFYLKGQVAKIENTNLHHLAHILHLKS